MGRSREVGRFGCYPARLLTRQVEWRNRHQLLGMGICGEIFGHASLEKLEQCHFDTGRNASETYHPCKGFDHVVLLNHSGRTMFSTIFHEFYHGHGSISDINCACLCSFNGFCVAMDPFKNRKERNLLRRWYPSGFQRSGLGRQSTFLQRLPRNY